MARRLLAFCAVMSLWLVSAVSVAQAATDTPEIIAPQNTPATAEDGWQAGTCTEDEPTKCSPSTPSQFFTTAAGHPQIGFTQYTLKHKVIVPNTLEEPEKEIEVLRVELPPGLTVNPLATERCPLATFEVDETLCPAGSKVGREEVTVALKIEIPNPSPPPATLPPNFVIQPSEAQGTKVTVYNLEPKPGEPALFGFKVGATKEEVFLTTDVDWQSDYHENFTIVTPPASPVFKTLRSRLVNFGRSGDGTYITNPTTCFAPAAPNEKLYSTFFRASAREDPNPLFPTGASPVEARVESSTGTKIQQIGCDTVPFDPTVDVSPGTTEVDSPAAVDVVTSIPFKTGGTEQSQSHLRQAKVTLPAGMGLNPSGSNGLVACSDAQFKKGVRVNSNECPANSEVGTITIDTPPLPVPLTGKLYVGEQKSSNPESGDEFRLLAEAKDLNAGVVVRLVGKTAANAKTGQLTTTFYDEEVVGKVSGTNPDGLPQAPFKSVTLHFDGSKEILTSPPTCSAAGTTGQMEPWARPGQQVATPPTSFTLSSDPAGGTCPTTLADRKFSPGYTAKSNNPKAGKYSPFKVHIGRTDGQQELKLVDVTLPKGLTGNLSQVPYCPEAALTAATASTGAAEKANPSCSSKSQIGTTSTTAGTGSHPVTLAGSAYLAGPYKGAPISMAVITPALSGPFDLGTVVVRVALNVNPKTAQVNAVSDAIPDVFGGVKLDLRAIDVNVNRKKFMLNPTNCSKQATAGFLRGGGGDPTDPAAWSSYAVSAPYQATKCKKLGFKPKLYTRLFAKGNTTRAKHPKLRAILTARKGDANVLRSALALPHALFLDQGNIGTVCTKPQLASRTCPKKAIYGHAEAKSPLLKKKLKGPVYLVSSKHELPDLVADLRGQVRIQLYGVISSKNGGIKTVFNRVPDVPVTKFILRMKGGKKKGLLQNSQNICKGPLSSVMNMKGQNGKKVKNNKLPLKVSGCGKKKKH